MTNWRTLEEIWKENGEKAIDVDIHSWSYCNPFHVAAKTPKGYFIGWDVEGDQTFLEYNRIATLHVPPKKKVAHWLAICSNDHGTWIDHFLFKNFDEAKKENPQAVRLATEYPAIMLEIDDD